MQSLGGPRVPWLPPPIGHIAIGVELQRQASMRATPVEPPVALEAVGVTGSIGTATLPASGAISADPTLGVDRADDRGVGGEEVDYGPLVTLVGLTSGSGCLVLAFVTGASTAEEGVLWGAVAVVFVGILYLYGNLDPLANWVADQRRKRRR